MTHLVAVVVLLTLLYALVLNSFALADLATGLLVSGLLVLSTRRYIFGKRVERRGRSLRRLAALFPFSWAILKEILTSTWRVLLISLRLRPLRQAGIVAVPMGDRTAQGVKVTAYVMTLTPGSFLVDLDWERRAMYFHVVDATDPDAVREAYGQFYRRYQQPIFP